MPWQRFIPIFLSPLLSPFSLCLARSPRPRAMNHRRSAPLTDEVAEEELQLLFQPAFKSVARKRERKKRREGKTRINKWPSVAPGSHSFDSALLPSSLIFIIFMCMRVRLYSSITSQSTQRLKELCMSFYYYPSLNIYNYFSLISIMHK